MNKAIDFLHHAFKNVHPDIINNYSFCCPSDKYDGIKEALDLGYITAYPQNITPVYSCYTLTPSGLKVLIETMSPPLA